MARKTDSSTLNYAIDLVRGGSSVSEAVKQSGVSASVIKRAIHKFGVKTPETLRKERLDNLAKDMITMYQSGESENAVAKHFGISRNVVRRYLNKFGVKPRTQSEAETLKWSKMTQEQRDAQVKSAHERSKGTPKTNETKISIAKARERIKYDFLIGFGETEFTELLKDRGINFVHQKAIHSYNVDFAIGNVAVELTADRGRYTRFNAKELNRAKDLLERGYQTLAVEFSDNETLIACSDYIISVIDEMRGLKSPVSEYWVVSCRSQDYTITKDEFGKFASVPSPVKYVTKRRAIKF